MKAIATAGVTSGDRAMTTVPLAISADWHDLCFVRAGWRPTTSAGAHGPEQRAETGSP